jgi:hypothetical protein
MSKTAKRYKPKKPGTLGRKKPPGKEKPKTVRHLVTAFNKGRPIDNRTKVGKSITQVKEALTENLDEAAEALLLSDAANASVIMAEALAVAYKDISKLINDDGSYHKALGTWLKFSGVKRSSLLALKKFRAEKEPESKEPELGSLILSVSEESEGYEQPS